MNQKKNSDTEDYIPNYCLYNIDVVILCGGLGTRLRPIISDKPKVLAKIGNHAFLDILIRNISSYGAKNIILCVGYLKDHIKRHFDHHCNCNIIFSEEENPLGTGGAIKNAKSLITSNPFLVMNGDSICNMDFNEFFDFHVKNEAILSLTLVKSDTIQDYGHVALDKSQKIISFNEKMSGNSKHMTSVDFNKKDPADELLINAGIYIMQNEIFSYMPRQDNFSLENDLFPKIVSDETTRSRCYGFLTDNKLLDIGTPERYKMATDILL